MAASPQIPPGLPNTAVLDAALTQMDGRATALSSTVKTLTADFNIVRVHVGDLISAVGALQTATPSSTAAFPRVRALRTLLPEKPLALSATWALDGHACHRGHLLDDARETWKW